MVYLAAWYTLVARLRTARAAKIGVTFLLCEIRRRVSWEGRSPVYDRYKPRQIETVKYKAVVTCNITTISGVYLLLLSVWLDSATDPSLYL